MSEPIASRRPYPIDTALHPDVVPFFEPVTGTGCYLVRDPSSRHCAVIDPVLDFALELGRISYGSADCIVAYVKKAGLDVDWLIETHAHADHLSASSYIKGQVGGKICIGENIKIAQEMFGKIFDEDAGFSRDGSQFDRLLRDGDCYSIGAIPAFAMSTPGHTPACMTHVIGDAVFVGDTILMPDAGTARADFPGGNACELYRSIKKILSLPAQLRVFVGHDYGPRGREIRWQTTVEEERRSNIHVRDGLSEAEFLAFRVARDKTLPLPRLIIPSIQVNIRAGELPRSDVSGKPYLKIPINAL